MAETYLAKSVFVSKTMWFNAISLLIAVLSATDIIPLFPSSWAPRIAGLVAVANLFLRFVTVRPVAFVAPNATLPISVDTQ